MAWKAMQFAAEEERPRKGLLCRRQKSVEPPAKRAALKELDFEQLQTLVATHNSADPLPVSPGQCQLARKIRRPSLHRQLARCSRTKRRRQTTESGYEKPSMRAGIPELVVCCPRDAERIWMLHL
ncbi:hypothetical protein ABBQ38_001592 [Trebouxia sp. C0009 RCD-2024]